MLERHHLIILRAVRQQGTLTGAATSLHLTQSALSHSIKKLEQSLGTPVWQKDGRTLTWTQAGRQLLALAERVLPQFDYVETLMAQYACGQRGNLRIGMECHPCYQWLLKLVPSYLANWPDVDVDVKQQFQFGGMGALFNYDIDMLITPDPIHKTGLVFTPVFDYEQVLVVAVDHPLAQQSFIEPAQLAGEVVITYPVEASRLDIFSLFMLPQKILPRQHKTMETTDMLLQMVAAGRGVTALPAWLAAEYQMQLPIRSVRLGATGLEKQIHLGIRKADADIDYIKGFVDTARVYQMVAPTFNPTEGTTNE